MSKNKGKYKKTILSIQFRNVKQILTRFMKITHQLRQHCCMF